MDPIVINIMDLTQGITQQDLSTGLIVVTDATIPLQLINAVDQLGDNIPVNSTAYNMATTYLRQRRSALYILGVTGTSGNATVEEVITELRSQDIPYYYFAMDLNDQASRKAMADYQAARIAFFCSEDGPSVEADISVANALALNTEACTLIAHNGIKDTTSPGTRKKAYSDCALLGKMAPIIEGGAPWFYQALDGIPDGAYSAADVNKLYTGNVCTVTTYMKRVETWTGKTTKGSYCHFKVLKDWLVVRLKENLAKTIHNDAGVFMNEEGLAEITASIKEIMEVGRTRGTINAYTVYTPRRADIPSNDRANGIVNGFQIQCTFTGFIEKVVINIIAEV